MPDSPQKNASPSTALNELEQLTVLREHLKQGILVIDKTGNVMACPTQITEKFFGGNPLHKNIKEIFHLEGKEAKDIDSWLDMLFSEMYDFEDLAGLGVRSFDRLGDRYLEMEYFPVYSQKEDGSKFLSQILCIAADKTREQKIKEDAQRDMALVKMATEILKDRSAFIEGIVETRKFIEATKKELLKDPKDIDTKALMRYMHTIKGITASYAIMDVSQLAHEFEDDISELIGRDQEKLSNYLSNLQAGVSWLDQIFESFLQDNKQLIGELDIEKGREATFPLTSFYNFSQKIFEELGKSSVIYKDFLKTFILEEVSQAFKRYEHLVISLAESQMKKVKFNLNQSDIHLCMEPYLGLLNNFVHLFRNAVDHGIELPDNRLAMGKEEEATIEIKFEKVLSDKGFPHLRIIVSDDGNGIDPHKIKYDAVKKGIFDQETLDKKTTDELIQIIFHPGFSSKETVTDISGRGVGLDSLQSEAKVLNGKVWVTSEECAGSTFFVEVPIFETLKQQQDISTYVDDVIDDLDL